MPNVYQNTFITDDVYYFHYNNNNNLVWSIFT